MEISRVWEIYSDQLKSFIGKRVNNPQDAEDVLQDVFLKISEHITELNEEDKLGAWVYKIARNSIVDFYRRKKDLPTQIGELEKAYTPDYSEDIFRHEAESCLRSLLLDIPEKYGEPLRLHDLEGMKHSDIADLLQLSESGSKTRVQRGRQRLKVALTDCCDFEFDATGRVMDYHPKKDCAC